MSEKPSLYVVEKKEVIILVVLFVLVTVLSFTLGVRYGESVGKKQAVELAEAAKEHGESAIEGGGSLGKSGHTEEHVEAKHEETKKDEHAEAVSHEGAHEGTHEAVKETKPEGEKHEETKGEEDSHSPEAAAHSTPLKGTHEAVDKNSDEYLLNALKDAGVESPGGKAPKEAKLPDSVKEAKKGPPAEAVASRVHSGAYVIQVGSHPTRAEAEAQVKTLRAHKVNAEILTPFKDKQGEWHRVVIASFKSKHEAEREAGSLKGKGSIASYFVWRLP